MKNKIHQLEKQINEAKILFFKKTQEINEIEMFIIEMEKELITLKSPKEKTNKKSKRLKNERTIK